MPIVSREIRVGPNVTIGGNQPLFLIGGPCVIEGEDHALQLAREIKKVCSHLNIPLIFKASYDKANRSSHHSFRGLGMEKGLAILRRIKHEVAVPVLSDVHETSQVEKAAEVLDVIQIPALLCRQTDLIIEAARTKKPLNIKKGQFLSAEEMKNIVDKALSQGNEDLILTERGTFFGYHNLVFDVRSIPFMKKLGFPVAIDASHSVQKPGGEGASSGGEAEFIPHVALAGLAAGADGVFLEIHDQPEKALSDKYNSFNISKLERFLAHLLKLKEVVKEINTNDLA